MLKCLNKACEHSSACHLARFRSKLGSARLGLARGLAQLEARSDSARLGKSARLHLGLGSAHFGSVWGLALSSVPLGSALTRGPDRAGLVKVFIYWCVRVKQGRRHGFSPVGAIFLIYIVDCVLPEFQWGQQHSFAPTASAQWGQAAPTALRWRRPWGQEIHGPLFLSLEPKSRFACEAH